MKVLTKNKPRNLRFSTLSRKIIQLTTISLLTMTLQVSAAEDSKTIALSGSNLSLVQKVVKGKVIDEKGNPIPGANIIAQGTKVTAQTDGDGNFEINVPDNVTKLVVTYIGMEEQEVAIGSAPLRIVLKEVGQKLDEVIVVGYGTQKKKDLTGSVSSIGKESLNLGGTTTNVASALQGRASGVQVQQNSFAPGSSPSIVIRGGNSINTTNEPLYVVDGFISDAGKTISPNDIEDIQILKDASAAAIYGSRGGNGVVLITTKKGKSGKLQIEADISDGIQNIIHTPSLLNGQQYADIQNAIAIENGKPLIFPVSFPIANTNWFKLATRQGSVKNRSINFSGSDKTSKFFLSGNYINQEGVLRNTEFDRYSIRMGAEKKFSDKITVGSNFYGAISHSNNSDYSDGILSPLFSIQTAPPSIPVYNADGSYFKYQGKDNAFALLMEPTNKLINRLINGNMFVDYEIVKNLTYHFGAGAEFRSSTEDKYTPRTLSSGAALRGVGSEETISNLRWITDNYLTYKLALGEHAFTVLLGTSNQKDYSERLKASASGFANDYLTSNSLGDGEITYKPITQKAESKLKSYFGRLNYSYGDKYLATFTLRDDESSKFPENHRKGYFPSAALAWKVSNESFMKNLDVFSNLKLRASWGITGNDRIEDYAYLGTYQSYGTTLSPGVFVGGTEPKILPNPNLTWESTTQTDLGLDMGFLNGRINTTIDVYRKVTDDLLLNLPIGLEYGFNTIRANAGKMQNQGFELGINSTNVKNDNFSWNSAFNIAFNKQKVVSLANGVSSIFSSTANPSGVVSGREFTKLEPGKELGLFFGFEYAGVIKTGEVYAPQPNSKPGDPKYTDINGDGKITPEDRKYMGNSTPKFIAGFSNDFRYGNFDLTVFFQGAFDYSLYNMSRMVSESTTGTDALNRWVKNTNENTDVPRQGYYASTYGSYVNSRFIENATYVRLKNVSIGYNIPSSALRQAKFIDNIRLYASGQNLATFTKYSGNDPEVNGHSGSNTGGGIDFNSFPASRNFVLGLKVTIH